MGSCGTLQVEHGFRELNELVNGLCKAAMGGAEGLLLVEEYIVMVEEYIEDSLSYSGSSFFLH